MHEKTAGFIKYRPDIDGLRAVAVVAVIVFHAFPSALQGGFIGVDIFFVISGFLISSILFSGLERNEFRFVNFYVRRAKRIFPTLSLVLMACVVFGWFALLADEYKLLGKHVFAGAGFFSNWLLSSEKGYFDEAADTKPLLHLWSLAIEEQFYLIWPALLWAGRKLRLNLLVVTCTVLIVSFVLNVLLVGRDPVGTFYAPQTRFWELLIGAALAYLSFHYQGFFSSLSHVTQELLSAIGMALIAVGLILLTATHKFPGFWALLPTAGTALVIAAGPKAWLNRNVLANPVPVWIGLVSYPLYLWHWPLLSFARIVENGEPSITTRLLVVAAALLLSWGSYRLVETPIRFAKSGKFLVAGVCASVAFAGLLGFVVFSKGGFEGLGFRNNDSRNAFISSFENSRPVWAYFEKNQIPERYRFDCDFYDVEAFRRGGSTAIPRAIAVSCTAREPARPKLLFIWGDSHAQQYYHGLKTNLPREWDILQVASSACRPSVSATEPSNTDYCAQSNWFALKTIGELKPDAVLVAQAYDHTVPSMNVLGNKLKELGAKRTVFAGPVPRWTANLPDIVARSLWFHTPRRTRLAVDAHFVSENNILKKQFTHTEQMAFFDAIGAMCNGDGCLVYLGDDVRSGITTWDKGHLTPTASRYVAEHGLIAVILGQQTKSRASL